MRLAATDGYFSAVFTPTLGQEFWRESLEVKGYKERFPKAFKKQVSMYDCLYYEDGTPSFWTKERIGQIEASCKSQAEIQRRVYGRFVMDSGLRYPGFQPSINLIEPVEIPNDFAVYIGVDSGSGGRHNHPAAITAVAISPNFQKGLVFKGRRFDGVTTTASDLVEFVRAMKAEIKNPIYGIFYDHAAHDLGEISARMGDPWIHAEKSHLIGEQILNVGFKNKMLQIFNTEELAPLVSELKSVRIDTPKTLAKDDFIDSLRYAVTKAPWDWSAIGPQAETMTARQLTVNEERKKFFQNDFERDDGSIGYEISEWNALMHVGE